MPFTEEEAAIAEKAQRELYSRNALQEDFDTLSNADSATKQAYLNGETGNLKTTAGVINVKLIAAEEIAAGSATQDQLDLLLTKSWTCKAAYLTRQIGLEALLSLDQTQADAFEQLYLDHISGKSSEYTTSTGEFDRDKALVDCGKITSQSELNILRKNVDGLTIDSTVELMRDQDKRAIIEKAVNAKIPVRDLDKFSSENAVEAYDHIVRMAGNSEHINLENIHAKIDGLNYVQVEALKAILNHDDVRYGSEKGHLENLCQAHESHLGNIDETETCIDSIIKLAQIFNNIHQVTALSRQKDKPLSDAIDSSLVLNLEDHAIVAEAMKAGATLEQAMQFKDMNQVKALDYIRAKSPAQEFKDHLDYYVGEALKFENESQVIVLTNINDKKGDLIYAIEKALTVAVNQELLAKAVRVGVEFEEAMQFTDQVQIDALYQMSNMSFNDSMNIVQQALRFTNKNQVAVLNYMNGIDPQQAVSDALTITEEQVLVPQAMQYGATFEEAKKFDHLNQVTVLSCLNDEDRAQAVEKALTVREDQVLLVKAMEVGVSFEKSQEFTNPLQIEVLYCTKGAVGLEQATDNALTVNEGQGIFVAAISAGATFEQAGRFESMDQVHNLKKTFKYDDTKDPSDSLNHPSDDLIDYVLSMPTSENHDVGVEEYKSEAVEESKTSVDEQIAIHAMEAGATFEQAQLFTSEDQVSDLRRIFTYDGINHPEERIINYVLGIVQPLEDNESKTSVDEGLPAVVSAPVIADESPVVDSDSDDEYKYKSDDEVSPVVVDTDGSSSAVVLTDESLSPVVVVESDDGASIIGRLPDEV